MTRYKRGFTGKRLKALAGSAKTFRNVFGGAVGLGGTRSGFTARRKRAMGGSLTTFFRILGGAIYGSKK